MHLAKDRFSHIFFEARGMHVIGLCGTSIQHNEHQQFDAHCKFNMSHQNGFECYSFGFGKQSRDCKSTGVMLCLQARMFPRTHISEFHWPMINKHACILGRAGAVRFVNGRIDVCFICLYFPPIKHGADKNECLRITDAIIDWTSKLIAALPRRCSLAIFVDLNDYLGFSRLGSEWVSTSSFSHVVGDVMPAKERFIFERFRAMLQLHSLSAINSFFPQAGNTFHSHCGRKHGTRVDFICLPPLVLPIDCLFCFCSRVQSLFSRLALSSFCLANTYPYPLMLSIMSLSHRLFSYSI